MRAGTLRFDPGMTIVGAISASGGFTSWAMKSQVEVLRLEGDKRVQHVVDVAAITGGAKPDFVLRAGDVVRVLEDTF